MPARAPEDTAVTAIDVAALIFAAVVPLGAWMWFVQTEKVEERRLREDIEKELIREIKHHWGHCDTDNGELQTVLSYIYKEIEKAFHNNQGGSLNSNK